jgi:hypothetical protein
MAVNLKTLDFARLSKFLVGTGPGRTNRTSDHTALLLESIALRHQIAVLERSRTRRPRFRRFKRLFWILLSH